jgi:aspartate ammonia-lyase
LQLHDNAHIFHTYLDDPPVTQTRLEHGLLGEREVPAERYNGIQTLRALGNFDMTGIPIAHYPGLVNSLAYIKKAAALANADLGLLDATLAQAIAGACDLIMAGQYHSEFVVDLIQGDAGTMIGYMMCCTCTMAVH